MHSSISAHIAKEYLLDEARDVWGPNLALFRDRLGNTGGLLPALSYVQLLPASHGNPNRDADFVCLPSLHPAQCQACQEQMRCNGRAHRDLTPAQSSLHAG